MPYPDDPQDHWNPFCRKCNKPAIYWVYKYGVINRFLCGWHTVRYFKANEGAAFAARLAEKDTYKPPYRIQVVDPAFNKLTQAELKRLEEFGYGTKTLRRGIRGKWLV